MLWGQMSIWGHFHRQSTPSVMAKCLVSSFFLSSFFLSSFFLSFFWQHFRDLYLRHAWTDFNQTWSQEPLTHGIYVIWPEWGQRSRRGHRGQKGQKLKNATPPTDYRVWSRDSCICISLTPSTKVMGLEIHPGSFGVTGVKSSFSLKML